MNFSKLAKKAAKNAWMIKNYITPAIVAVCAIDGENILTMCRGVHGGPLSRTGSRRGKYSAMFHVKHNISVSRKRN